MDAPLMQRAQERAEQPEQAGEFKRPDTTQFVPEDQQDAYARVIAAGQKLMYSPGMREDLQAEIERDAPVPTKMAEAVTGLMLTMDKQSQGGLPVAVIFPAGMELLSEAAEVLMAAGQPVTQEDWNEAARQMYVLMGRKFGAKDEDIMGAAAKSLGGGEMPEDDMAEGMPEPDEQEMT
jgi:hypothetical protein